jgi:hypothetical protein
MPAVTAFLSIVKPVVFFNPLFCGFFPGNHTVTQIVSFSTRVSFGGLPWLL